MTTLNVHTLRRALADPALAERLLLALLRSRSQSPEHAFEAALLDAARAGMLHLPTRWARH